jgi:benzoate-CoA ligase family protein
MVSGETGPRLNMADYFLFSRLAGDGAGRTAVITDSGTSTYGELAELASGMAEALRSLGVRAEQRVLIALPDGVEYAATLFAILQTGAVVVMINPELRPDHLRAILDAARAPVAVVDPAYAEVLRAAAASSLHPPELLELTPGSIAPAPVPEASFPTHRDDPAVWLFSGGTTGVPKIVVQTHRSFVNTTRRYAHATLGYGPDDRTISVPRLYFGYATGSNLLFPYSVGAASVLFAERPTPEVLFRQIRRHRPTILITAPSAVNAMLAYDGPERVDLSSLRFATSAGEALPETLYHRWKERFGVELLDGLGTAEMWHIFVTNRVGDVRPGTVGKVVDGFEVRVCDDDGNPLPAGEVGKLWVRGGSRALGYWQDLDQTAAAFRGEWFVGGDLASIDDDGYVTHRGRADDAIKVKGKWLRPQDVESCLLEHPAVAECAVVAVEDDDGLLKPVAFVVAASEVTAQELQQHVLARLEPYKHPRQVIFVDSLPRTHLGKVDRGRLRASFRADPSTQGVG